MDIEIMGEDLLFPEGPVVFPDGSVVLVELRSGDLTRIWGDGRKEVVAHLGGGPNGAALGPDGAIYVCNNGGYLPSRNEAGAVIPRHPQATPFDGGRIERVDLATGKSERIYTHCEDRPLRGPNDLVFDRTGGVWFTDHGKVDEAKRDLSGLFYATPDGRRIEQAVFGALSFNGVGLSPDENTLYVADTHSARLWAFDLDGPGALRRKPDARHSGRLIGTAPGDVMLDSLAVTQAGDVCVGALIQGSITTFRLNGAIETFPTPDSFATNLCFGGRDRRDAYITLSTSGRLAKVRWPEPGLALNFNPY